ncbi:LTA synthase family protein [Anaeromicropila populeti]|uniref:Phosphoglycerol transferase MdoB n=1 Tax=Anaeromicropila populeti TaxID=37658 RepID=A0A1I6JND3_9FIRM|nr:alkaline phosphatase family protein [Anaeromicropila populeti]SFR80457.1 Phosphoglycerol transferase MdoB [Anaeromicropila populeti]
MKEQIKKIPGKTWANYLVLTLVINLILEMLNRRSFIKGILFIFDYPLVFLYNALIIFVTLSISFLVKRRFFASSLIVLCWLVCGSANCIIKGFRSTPFSAIDMMMLKNAIEIMDVYVTPVQLVLGGILLVMVLIGLIVLFLKAPKVSQKPNIIFGIIFIIGLVSIDAFVTNVGVNAKVLSDDFENLAYAYENYGFAYCFSNSILDVGIEKPDDYSEDAVLSVLSDMTDDAAVITTSRPNLIMIQLESFIDPNILKNITLSENPVPNFTYLKENYSTGLLTVPSIGAGTANTEFEILTGMSTDFFGAGEYPYKTILTDVPCESISNLLKKQSYSTHAIHNNDGTFYNRNTVFSNMGFDTFTPIEYMYHATNNPIGWAKDDVLTEEIMKCLNSSISSDFIYTISVQGHGRYPKKVVDDTQSITVTGYDEYKIPFEYYLNQIHEMDEFIGDLIDSLEKSGEPTVLVMYGDHFPTLGITDEMLTKGNMFQTEYVVWDNIGLEKQHTDLYAYQLSNHLFEMLNLKKGIMQKYHSTYIDSENYKKNMQLLEYDMLYGENYTFNQTVPYEPSNLKYGIDNIAITFANLNDTVLTVTGRNFNQYSTIYINDKQIETEFINSNLLTAKEISMEEGDSITVAQVGADHAPLGFTTEYIFK